MKKNISLEGLKDLKLNANGLTQIEIEAQRKLFGLNEIMEVSQNQWFELIKDTLTDPMIWFLLIIGSAFLFLGNQHEAVILFVAILPLLFMDSILHWRTKSSTASLKSRLSSKVKVIREGKEKLIDTKEIVPGDLVILNTGDYISADGIFERAQDLQVDESVITGEAFSVSKTSYVDVERILKERDVIFVEAQSLGFAGTRVLTGTGIMRVLFTGVHTDYGEIIKSVEMLPHERTPLQKSITKMVRILILSALAFCLILAGVRIYQGYGWLDALISAATLAVAAIPEEFPVVFTFFLGVGVYRLAKRKAFVRRAVSVENIGRVTYICTDKTGTVTLGQLRLAHYDPEKNIEISKLLLAAVCASDPLGSDPMDQAIVDATNEKQINFPKRLVVFPFTEDRRCEVSFVKENQQEYVCYAKGAPETILNKTELTEDEKREWFNKTSQWAKEGHRVLACAYKKITAKEVESKQEPTGGFSFYGLVVFEDPARPEVPDAIQYCIKNSIGVLMITGDHPATAMAIANDIGLGKGAPKVLTAEEQPEKLTPSYLESHPSFLKSFDVVARCTPMQKLEIVKALRASGELVAVTGDGVNDVPALKSADIAIAMGERGTRSAKEASSIVLADDNFQTIVNAIIEGRQLFLNLKMSFEYLLLIHIPLVLTAALIPVMGYPLLYLPVHIVWLELIIHPTALLAFQNEGKYLSEKQKRNYIPESRFFTNREWFAISILGLIVTGVLAFIYVSDQNQHQHFEFARTKALAILTFWSAGIVAVKTRLKKQGALITFLLTIISTVFLIQEHTSAEILRITALSITDWLQVCGLVVTFLVLLLSF